MKKVRVDLTVDSYPVFIGNSILSSLKETILKHNLYKKLLVIIDEGVSEFYSDEIKRIFFKGFNKVLFYKLKSGERSKSYKELNNIYAYLLENKFGRDSLIVAFGGGVTGDLSGYAASTYTRGIQIVHVPTTLLAMVDSSIGGKTGINFDNKKNMIGTFYQPDFVFIDTDFLKTLPRGEITSGIGEIIKYTYMSDRVFFNFVQKNINKIYDFDSQVIEGVIQKSVLIKAGVVSQDEKESGLRKILNLGHTFAHAYESDLNFKIKHGEAVTAGVISALVLSNRLGLLPLNKYRELLTLPLKIKLNKKAGSFNTDNAYKIMLSDKKNREGKIKFVLLKDIGKLLIDVEAGEDDVYYALNSTKEILNS